MNVYTSLRNLYAYIYIYVYTYIDTYDGTHIFIYFSHNIVITTIVIFLLLNPKLLTSFRKYTYIRTHMFSSRLW